MARKYYLSVDGGGTRVQALLFDENGKRLGFGAGGSVNPNFTPVETIESHMSICIDTCLDAFCEPIDTLYISFPGPHDLFYQLLRERIPVGSMQSFSEGRMGLLSGILKPDGFIALSGTGSCVTMAYGEQREYQGGWGSILGDEGSAYDIGVRSLQSAIRASDGWGEPTILQDMIPQHFAIDELRGLVPIIYRQAEYRSRIASVARLTSAAAVAGDKVALAIYRAAADQMSAQMSALLKRWYPRGETYQQLPLTVCGGAWKGHSTMFLRFANQVCQDPTLAGTQPLYPQYEMVTGGVTAMLINEGRGDEAADILTANYDDLRYPSPAGGLCLPK